MENSAILLIDCPDQKGLVSAISSFLYAHGAMDGLSTCAICRRSAERSRITQHPSAE
jgi:hypothetical protein